MRFPYIFFLLVLAGLPATGWAQPANDECENAIFLDDTDNWCSGFAAYSTIGSTPSVQASPFCFPTAQQNNDIWFAFVAQATDVNISVTGQTDINQGGNLLFPQFALYSGDCGNLTEIACASDAFGEGIIQSFAGPLNIGETYYIRVGARLGQTGTFRLCVNNFNLIPEPSGDCNTGVVLCDKSPFTVPSVIGVGNDPNEIANTMCGCPIAESSSTWYKWTCDEPGSLTFTLTPLNPTDDLDFVLYELPNGLDDCSNKNELRCMASGENVGAPFSEWQPCTGATGMSLNDNDTSESCGCQVGDNNFVSAIQMEAGRSYALVINNFSDSGDGFSIEFGGEGTFRGPEASFLAAPESICVGETITFTDNSTAPDGIVEWEWNFGSTATPSTSSSSGPIEVTFDRPGMKSILLRVTSSDGCLVSFVSTVMVECCDDHFFVDGTTTDLLCGDIPTGAVDLTATSDFSPYIFTWSNGQFSEDLTGLDIGTYTVSISDDVGCDTTATFTIDGPPPIAVNPIVGMPTCNGGMDGSITMEAQGGVPPYEYDFGAGFTSGNVFANIPVGDYLVTVRDQNGCIRDTLVEVRELELVLDPSINPINRPTCFNFSDGSIEVVVSNGLPPYEYNFNDGNGWVTSNVIDELPAGTYVVDVRDANLCLGSYEFTVVDFPPVEAELSVTDVSCFGLSDGIITAVAEGGVGNYTYQWSDGQTGPEATDLVAGTYTVTVADGNGCSLIVEAEVKEPDPVFIDLVEVVNLNCFGEPTGAIEVAGSGGVPPFEYSIDGENFQPAARFEGLPAGDFRLTVRDSRGCTAFLEATVIEPPPFIVDAGPDQIIRLGFSTGLRAVASEPVISWQWTPVETLDCTDCPDPETMPLRSTTYTATAVNERGCVALDSVRIIVVPDRPIYIPNAITPDGDGVNDGFTVFGGPAARQIRNLKIFSRWGSLVFDSDNLPMGQESAGWDGTFNGKPVNPGVFVYIAEVEFIDDEVLIYEGDVTVLR